MHFNRKFYCVILITSLILVGLWYLGSALGKLFTFSRNAGVAAEFALTFFWVLCVVMLIRSIAALKLRLFVSFYYFLASLAVLVMLIIIGAEASFTGLFLIYSASFVGVVVSHLFRDANIILPIALLAPLIDFWTVYHGPVGQVIKYSPDTINKVSAAIPSASSPMPLVFIGAGDFLFMAMFLAAADRLKMDPGRTVWYYVILITLALLVVIAGPSWIGFPGLVAIGLGFIAANWRHFRLSKQELIITVILSFIAVLIILYIGLKGASRI